jgi:tetratricopeptide (TPR) repeat protein
LAELDSLKFQRDPMVITLINASRAALREGDRAKAYKLLQEAAQLAPEDETIWWALIDLVETEGDRVVCLENILVINPNNLEAKRLLRLAHMDVSLMELTPPLPAQNFSESPQPRIIRQLGSPPSLPPPPAPARRAFNTRRFVILALVFGLLAAGIAIVMSILLYGF